MRQLRRIGPRPLLLTRTVLHHGRRLYGLRRLRRTYAKTVAAPPPGAEPRLPSIDIPPLAELPAPLQGAARRILREAEAILDHRVDYLGSGPVELGPEIDWQLDFKSGYRWPAVFYQDVEVTRLDDGSDAKVPWELSRGHQLLTLARAYRLCGEERFAKELQEQLASWLDGNPPGVGINWTNAMEVALRAVNWIWALGTLEGGRPLERELRKRVTASLQTHARHVRANLEGAPYLRSNHYLSDVFGLFVLGASITGDPAAPGWLRLGKRALEREILSQVHEDGAGFEASTSYHGLALEIFLLGRTTASRIGSAPSTSYDDRLRRMLDFSRTIRHPDGRIPLFGDGDSGRVLPAGFGRAPTQDGLLWLGAAVLEGPAPLPGAPHEEVAWILGVDEWRRLAERRHDTAPKEPAAFPRGGVYVLEGGGTHVVVRCGDVGQNGNGGHAHNDALSYELSREVPIVVDSGTYVYTSDPSARNDFRSTAAHNTVRLDGAEINPIEANVLFAMQQVGRTSVAEWSVDDRTVRLVASHDGFRRLEGGGVHTRTIELDRLTGELSVEDELAGTGTHRVESFVHLASGTAVRVIDAHSVELECGPSRLRLRCRGKLGRPEIQDGWVSESFGRREPAPVLCFQSTLQLPARFGYTFVFDSKPHL